MKRLLWILLLLPLGGVIWLATLRNGPPELPFAKVKRETLVSTLTTNGKTEPVAWSPVHSEREGRVTHVQVERGSSVAAGTVLALLETNEAQAELASAQARLQQGQADLATLERGGRPAVLADIDGALRRLEVDRAAARRDVDVLGRLVKGEAAPRVELDAAEDKLAQLEAQIAAQNQRRAALVGHADISVGKARIADAEAALTLARRRLDQAVIRSPRAGTVYDVVVKEGAWLNSGDLVAKVGDLSKLRVTVYVDEPDLGRIRTGLPVAISWQAESGKQWSGVVDQVPSQVVALGTRQVGEVTTIAENPLRDLPPGANIDARIRVQVVEGALTMPRAALRRDGGELGVYTLAGNKLRWQKISLGVSSETRAEVRSGLAEGDAVALPTERALQAGQEVKPVFP